MLRLTNNHTVPLSQKCWRTLDLQYLQLMNKNLSITLSEQIARSKCSSLLLLFPYKWMKFFWLSMQLFTYGEDLLILWSRWVVRSSKASVMQLSELDHLASSKNKISIECNFFATASKIIVIVNAIVSICFIQFFENFFQFYKLNILRICWQGSIQ